MSEFDLIVIGTGVSGRTAAEEAAAAGLATALADCRPFGGTCALRGCEPKKVLFAAAETVMRARGQQGHGVTGDARLDWPELMAFKRRFTDSLPDAFESEFAKLGVTRLHGIARFVAANTLDVNGELHTARAFLVAPGAAPAPLGFPGAELGIDSERFMELPQLPARIVFAGGGFVSFELAGIADAAGAHCTILHRSAQPLRAFDPDFVALLMTQYAEEGITVRTNAPVVGVEPARVGDRDSSFSVVLGDGSRIAADLVVHGAGRLPDLAALDLDAAGVAFGVRGIEVDAQMHSTSNPLVWAAGDAAARGSALTPVGVSQARVAVRNIVAPGSATWEPDVVPSAVFSQPPLAGVGLSEPAALAAGTDVDVKFTDTSEWLSSQRVGLTHTGAKVLTDRGSGRILGAHILGHHAEEMVNLFALAVAQRMTATELKAVLWAYPTATSEIVYLL